MKNKELYLRALSHFTSNADEVIDDIINNNDWSNVIVWEPLEYYLTEEELKETVNNLYEDFLEVSGESQCNWTPDIEDITSVATSINVEVTSNLIKYVQENYTYGCNQDPTAGWYLVIDQLINEYKNQTSI